MTMLREQTTRLRRAAVIGVLLTVPLAPLTACGGGDSADGGGGAENEQGDGGDEDEDEGAY